MGPDNAAAQLLDRYLFNAAHALVLVRSANDSGAATAAQSAEMQGSTYRSVRIQGGGNERVI